MNVTVAAESALFMWLPATARTKDEEAVKTPEGIGCCSEGQLIDVGTIRSWAVAEFRRMLGDISLECDLEQMTVLEELRNSRIIGIGMETLQRSSLPLQARGNSSLLAADAR